MLSFSQLNELKNSTLLSYSQKATNDLAFSGDGKKKARKRATGIKTATGRLALRATDPDGKLGVNKNPKNEEFEQEGTTWGLYKGDGKPKGAAAAFVKKKKDKKKEEKKTVDEAKVDKGRSDYGKASIRNYRRAGPGHGEPGMFDPEGKRGKTIDKRREEHKARRGVKGAKVPAYKREEYVPEEGYDHWRDKQLERGTWKGGGGSSGGGGKKSKGKTVYQKQAEKEHGKGVTALDIVKKNIEKKHGKGAIMKNEEVISELSADKLLDASKAADKDRGKKAVAGDREGAKKRVKQAAKFYTASAKKRKSEAKEEYTVTNADKKGNTPAWQGYKSGKKNAKTGKPLYKAADHVKEGVAAEKAKKEAILKQKEEAKVASKKSLTKEGHWEYHEKEGLKRFSDFLSEGNPTTRMMGKSKTQQTGNISADRGTDAKKNKESRKGLEKDLKKKGIGYKKGVGEYKYDDGSKGREVSYQTSPAKGMSKRRFGKVMRRLGRKHGQESVITKDKNKPARLHDTESKKPKPSEKLGKTKPGKHPKGYGETSGTKVRSKNLSKKTNKPSFHYG